MTPPFPTQTHGRQRTPWAVFCKGPNGKFWKDEAHKLVYLTEDEFENQLDSPDVVWKCPLCGCPDEWNDHNYQEMND